MGATAFFFCRKFHGSDKSGQQLESWRGQWSGTWHASSCRTPSRDGSGSRTADTCNPSGTWSNDTPDTPRKRARLNCQKGAAAAEPRTPATRQEPGAMTHRTHLESVPGSTVKREQQHRNQGQRATGSPEPRFPSIGKLTTRAPDSDGPSWPHIQQAGHHTKRTFRPLPEPSQLTPRGREQRPS